MSLDAKFSLTPRQSFKLQHGLNPGDFYVYAQWTQLGVYIGAGSDEYKNVYSYATQYEEDYVVLSLNPFPYPFPTTLPSDFYKHSISSLFFDTNVPTNKQYLLLIHLAAFGNARAPDYVYIVSDSPYWMRGIDLYVV